MNRREFIERLSGELRARKAEDQAAELLDDFNTHFDEALLAGKSEEAICEMLGDPAEIAAQCAGMGEAGKRGPAEPGDAQAGAVREAGPCRNLFIKLGFMNLQCAPWEGEKFRIAVMAQGETIPDQRIRIEEEGDTLSIIQRPDNDFPFGMWRFFQGNGDRTLRVDIPRGFRGELNASTGSGNINLSGLELEGKLHVQAGSGNISVTRLSSGEKLTCHTGSGNIRLEECSGKGDFYTGSGNINVKGHRGTIGARTGSGNQHLETDHLTEETKFETGSGNLNLDIGSLSAGLKLGSGSGNIVFDIRELRGNINGNTGSGTIRGILSAGTRARFILRTGVPGMRVHNDFEGDNLPEGLPVVELKAGSGSARIEKR
jgi:hypothetical protein